MKLYKYIKEIKEKESNKERIQINGVNVSVCFEKIILANFNKIERHILIEKFKDEINKKNEK